MSSQAGPAQQQRVALVSGAGQGVGLGIARSLLAAGYCVALADLEDNAQRAALNLGSPAPVLGLTLDVTQAAAWQAGVETIIATWGRLDVLVNNAAVSPRGTVDSTDEALWDRTMAINLKGPWLGIKASLPWLKQTAGTIINIGSTRASRPMRGLNAYCTSKAGLLGLTQQVAIDYLDWGITCNMVAPGWVDTPGERSIQAAHGRTDFPSGLRNLTTLEEIGQAVLYLASPVGKGINGVILYLDHGLHVADNAAMIYGGESAR